MIRSTSWSEFVSQSKLPEVSKDIALQKQHHQKTSFRDEFIRFLVAHEIEFGGGYV